MAGTWTVRGGRVLQRTDAGWEAVLADVEVRGNKISAIGAMGSARRTVSDLDASGSLILPGLVNSHMHSNDAILRGRHERLPLEIYMLAAGTPWGLDADPGLDLLRVQTQLAAAEALMSGTTAILDDCYVVGELTAEKLEIVEKAYLEIGIRARLGVDLSDLDMPDTLAGLGQHLSEANAVALRRPRQPIRDQLSVVRTWMRDGVGSESRVRRMVNASGPQRCTDELLVQVAEMARSFDSSWSTHLVETKAQAVTGRERYRESVLQHCHTLGLVDERAVFAHGIWLDRADVDTLAASGATVVHNPSSNLRLGSGVAPVRELLAAGANVGLGTDGIASNDSQNMFLEMRLAASLQNITTPERRSWLTADLALDMATTGGRAAFREPLLGSLDVGAPADFTVLRTDTIPFTPLGREARNIVYAELGQSVTDVVVDGDIVVRDGRLRTIDLPDLLAEARLVAERFFHDNRDSFAALAGFERDFDSALVALNQTSFDLSHQEKEQRP